MKRLLERLRLRRGVDEELAAYLEEKTADLMEAGIPEAEARLRARREFGNAALIAEDSRAALGFAWFDHLAQDLRYALRTMRRNPAFTAVAVLSLALGIGANTAIWGLLDTIVWRMLPVPHPEELWAVSLQEASGKAGKTYSYPLYTLWRDHNRSIGALATSGSLLWRDGSAGSNDTQHLGQLVSGNYFDVLGVPALIGRTITPADDSIEGAGGPQGAVAMLSYRYWRSAFQRDPGVLGKTINVNGVWATVVGVTPPEFFGTQVGSAPDVFLPIQLQPALMSPENLLHDEARSSTTWVTVLGRLPAGTPRAPIAAELTPLFARYEFSRMSPADQAKQQAAKKPLAKRVVLEPASRGFSRLRERFSEPLQVLMVLVAIVLFIACANVANLLLARANARQKEIAVRLAIGAGRWRILRQLLVESLVLAVAGGSLGLAFALWSSRLLIGMLPQGTIPLALEVSPDLRVLGFTATVSLLTGLLFGLAPAWRASGLGIGGALKQERTRGGRMPRLEPAKAVVVIEVALSVQLLAGAGLFICTLRNLAAVDAGFARKNVLQMHMSVDAARFPKSQWAAVYEQVANRVGSIPGVTAASLANHGLIDAAMTQSGPVHYPGYRFKPGESRQLAETYIGPDYFKATGIPLRAGRFFTNRDESRAAQVAIVNEELVRRYFAGRNPIGQRYGIGDDPDNIEIVGVVADAKYNDLRRESIAMAYYPWKQVMPARLNSVIVRTQGDPAAIAPAMRQAITAIRPDLFMDITTLVSQIDASLLRERLLARLSGFFGLLAVLLACIGLYGVMAYGVTRRTGEIGVRMALGAVPGDVVRMVLREALVLAAAGIAIGVPVSIWLMRLTRALLFGLEPNDPAVLAGAACALFIVCLAAGWLPARRASRTDPMAALRYE